MTYTLTPQQVHTENFWMEESFLEISSTTKSCFGKAKVRPWILENVGFQRQLVELEAMEDTYRWRGSWSTVVDGKKNVFFLRKRHNSLGGGGKTGAKQEFLGWKWRRYWRHFESIWEFLMCFLLFFLKISASWLRKKGMRPSMPLSDMSPEAWEGELRSCFGMFLHVLFCPPGPLLLCRSVLVL